IVTTTGSSLERTPAPPQPSHVHSAAGSAADPPRHAAPTIDLGDPVFVSRIVAEIPRPASLKRRLGHKGGDDPALVVMPRLELNDHVPGDQPQAVAILFDQSGSGTTDRRFRLRQGAVMQGERTALVLHEYTGPVPRDCRYF